MQNNKPLPRAAEVRSRRKIAHSHTALAAAVAALFTVPAAHAQLMQVEPAIGAEVTLSDNGNQGPSGREEADLALEVRPELWLRYQTSRLRAHGVLGATATTYVGGERTGTVYPSINLGGTLQALRDFLYVDADVVASRQYANPFAPRSSSGDSNAYSSYAYRIAPYVQGELPQWRLRYLLRNDFHWTRTSGDSLSAFYGDQRDDGFQWRVRGELATTGERRLGATYQYQRDYLKYPNQPEFVIEVGRAIASYRVTETLTVNARGGYEWEVFPDSEGSGPIVGGGFSWRPTPRSDFTAWWEDRFFGSSWDARLSHRTPWLAASLNSSRLLSYGTQSLFNIPRTENVFTSLDAILTTRVPDPIERSQAVRDLIAVAGLPPTLATPVPILSRRVDLQQAHSVSIGLLGARNSLVADAYYLTREGITAEGEPLPGPFRLFTDETQRGASVTASHRLARADSISLTQLWQRTEGTTLIENNAETTQWTTRLQYNRQLRPRTTAYAGVRHVDYASNVFPGFTENAVFVGIHHRFH